MSEDFITARQAYDLAMPNYEKHLQFLKYKILKAAQNGETKVVIRDEPYASWLCSLNNNNQEANRVLEKLKENGFSYRYFQYDGSQFSDFGMEIYWDLSC